MKKEVRSKINQIYHKALVTISMLTVAMGFGACNDEPVDEFTPMMTIEATTTGSATRTALEANGESYDVVWSAGDQIRIGSETFTLASGEGTTFGTFNGPQLADGTYDAYYATNSLQMPTTQTFVQGQISHSPMHATLTVNGGKPDKISFSNLGGLLRLLVKNNQMARVKSIGISGTSSISTTRIFLDCGTEGILLAENGTEFIVALAEGSYSGVEIEITDTKNNTCTKKLGNGMKLDIKRSQITDASFNVLFDGKYATYHMGHEYVDLGLPSGLKWATCNLGSDDEKTAGYYIAWGETKQKNEYTTQNYTSSYNSTGTLPLEYDAANVNWGGNWRMPTAAEVQELLDNCKCNVNNIAAATVTGKNNKHILLPIGGLMEGTTLQYSTSGYYWCSTANTAYPQTLKIAAGTPYVFSCSTAEHFKGLQIRPVCP